MGEGGRDEEVASPKKKTELKTRVKKIDTLFMTKNGRTYLYRPYKGVPPDLIVIFKFNGEFNICVTVRDSGSVQTVSTLEQGIFLNLNLVVSQSHLNLYISKHTKRQVNERCFPTCLLLPCLSPQFALYFL